MNKIGFVGLGVMGAPMAANLLRKGYHVTLYNRTPGKVDKLLELGGEEAASPAALARSSELIITMISNDDAIREIYYGENGLLSALCQARLLSTAARFRLHWQGSWLPIPRSGTPTSWMRPSQGANRPPRTARLYLWSAATSK